MPTKHVLIFCISYIDHTSVQSQYFVNNTTAKILATNANSPWNPTILFIPFLNSDRFIHCCGSGNSFLREKNAPHSHITRLGAISIGQSLCERVRTVSCYTHFYVRWGLRLKINFRWIITPLKHLVQSDRLSSGKKRDSIELYST